VKKFLLFGCGKDRHPMLANFRIVVLLKIKGDLDVHIENAGICFSTLKVATEPETGISDTA
jgi:hypothetical protein